MRKLLTLVLSVFLLQTSFSQITTSINPTIAQMQALLQGNGVVVSGLTITCPAGAYATFNNGSAALGGLNSGILLTTGTASSVGGPPTIDNSTSAGGGGSALGNTLSGGTTYDGCYINFLITPACNTLSISYVFASEEYPEYVNFGANDVFGFVISGPNPSGGNYNQKNIAVLPGTSTPVSIDNVNNGTANAGPCTNCAYYVADPPGLVYDGKTTVLTASTSVTPCQTYTMTIGVWDVFDEYFDSGVFLDVNGLSCIGSPTLVASVTPSVICSPQTVTLSLTGGNTTSGSYTWSAGASGGLAATNGSVVTANPSATTTYTLNYSDANTCPGTPMVETTTLTYTTLPAFTVTKSPAGTICSGQSATLTANGGAGTYSWTASTGLSSTTGSVVVASPTTTTTYTVVKSVGSCTVASVVTVSVSPPITAIITPSLATICTGQTATLVASGGTTYTWTASSGANPPSTATVTVTPGATTTYTVKAATGTCTASAVATVSITTAPSITVTPVSTNICSGQSATLTVTGGAAPYNWTASSGTNPAPGASTVVSPTTTTTYTVISGSGTCTTSAVSTVSITSIPTITLTPANTSICTGQSATLTVTGGSAPYVWTASSGANPPNGSSAVVSPASNTSYTVMSGSGTCTAIAVSNVSITTAPTVSVSPTLSSICSGQSVTLTTSGGTAPYNWTASSGSNPAPGTTAVVSPTITTTYTVLSGSGTCTASAVADVSVTPNFSISVTPSITTICPGATGTLVASGGTNYTWLPGLNNTATLTANPSSTTDYTIIATTGPCTNSTTATMSVNIVSTSVSATSNTYCVGGASVTLTGSGATTYSWDPPFGLSGTSGTTVTASPTITTTYTVTGTIGACTSTATVTITVPPVVTLSVTATNTLICAGTSVTLTASGASTYTWLPGAASGSTLNVTPPTTTDYTLTGQTVDGCVTIPASITINVDPAVSLTVTPSNTTICSGSSGTTLSVSGAATYTWVADASLSSTSSSTVTANPTVTTTYSVTGQSGVCTNSATATVSVITVSTSVAASSNTYCVGGASVTLTGSGATTYSWDPPAGLSGTSGATVTASPTVTTTYTLTGSTGACSSVTVVTITVPPTVTLSIATTNTLICPATSATLTASGASTYTWLPGAATTSTLDVSPAATTDYTVTGLTSDGCVTVPSTITINVAPAIVLTVTPSNTAICNGSGSASLTVSGATNYTWSPATGLSTPNSGTVTANPTVTTTYSIIGATGSCTSSATATVSVITVSTAVAASSNTYCVGGASVTLTGSGATTYSWDPPTGLSSTSGTTVTASPTLTTTYTLTGSTGACNSTTVVTITVPPLVSLSITATSTVICLNGPGTSLAASGASTYTWLPGTVSSSTLLANPPATTNYTVLGQTSEGCYAIPAVQTVSVSAPITPTITGSPTVCLTQTTSLAVSPSGVGLTYTWSPATAIQGAVSNSSISALPPGTATVIYTVTVSNGVCTGTDTAKLVVRTPPVGNFKTLNNDTICVGGCVTFSSTTTGSQPMNYEWYYQSGVGTSSVGVHPEACYGSAGSFSVTMVASNACGVDSVTKGNFVTVFDYPALNVYGDTTINIGETATVYATGGLNYSWSPNDNFTIDCPSCPTTVVHPTVTTEYIVVSSNSIYCKTQDTVTVIVDVNCGDFFIPNVFSPNDDGLNDVINVHGRCISTFNLQIFDRWGEKVFETSSISDGWDGTYRGQKMNTGVFVYKADGVSIDGQSFSMKGNITLIR
jgi:gliding motility-associated-like protein